MSMLPVQAIDLTTVKLKNGEWYAFDYAGRKFFATVYNNGLTGYLELTEIPDPYVCLDCGKRYQEGEHEHTPGVGHEFRPRGAP